MSVKMFSKFLSFFCFSLFIATNSFGSLVYTPENLNKKLAHVVVVIHGCLQSPESMALGSGWNAIADKNNLVVIYPKVKEGSHDLNCWSWFLEDNQKPQSGELNQIKTEIESTIKVLGLKKPRIFLTGISSGGATVAGLLACYPNFFAAAGIHSAPSYGTAKNLADAQRVLKDGPPEKVSSSFCDSMKNKTPVMVIQGLDDKVVNPLHAIKIIESFVGTKIVNSKQSGSEGGLNFQISKFGDKKLIGELVMIEGLGHTWAGYGHYFKNPALIGPSGKFPTSVPFFTEKGPSSTLLFWNFFETFSNR